MKRYIGFVCNKIPKVPMDNQMKSMLITKHITISRHAAGLSQGKYLKNHYSPSTKIPQCFFSAISRGGDGYHRQDSPFKCFVAPLGSAPLASSAALHPGTDHP